MYEMKVAVKSEDGGKAFTYGTSSRLFLEMSGHLSMSSHAGGIERGLSLLMLALSLSHSDDS